MGAWGTGAFDNDSAADWAGDLADAAPGQRVGIIRATLAAVAEHEGSLDCGDGEEAIAAAAVVASTLPGGPTIDEGYGPDAEVKAGMSIEADLVPLARRALSRVLEESSEWRELWEEAGKFEEVLEALGPVLRALDQRG